MAASAGGRSPPAPVLAPDGKPAGVRTALSAVAAPKSDAPSPAPEAAPRRGVRQELGHLGPAFPRYLLVLLIFTLGNASDAFLLLRAQDLGIALAAIPLLWGAHHVSKMLWSVPGGMLADRFGPRRAIIAGWLVYAAVYAGFAAAGQVWQVWALFLVYGLFYGLTEAPEKALVAALAPTGTRGLAFGAYHFAIGLAALPASLIFGLLWQAYGAAAAFLLGAALALLAALLLPLALPAQRPGSS
ncbi:MAG: MFS transporter [Gemmatimonadetes bacterium]|nr:MFS transporter [Gemmatimonadota bacterium]